MHSILSSEYNQTKMTLDQDNTSRENINVRYIVGVDEEPRQILQPITGYASEPLLSLEEACEPLLNIVPRLGTYIWIAKENSKNPVDGLTQDESAAIRLYTMEWNGSDDKEQTSLYFHLNQTLRQVDRGKLRPWFRFLKLFLTALAKLPNTSSQTVWRGVKGDQSHDYEPGSYGTWWAFSSCTKSLNVLESELYLGKSGTRTLFSIETINARDISSHSQFKKEDELLLTPGIYFEVKSRLNPAPDLFIVHLRQAKPLHQLLEPPFQGA